MKSSVFPNVRVIVASLLVTPALVSAHHGISAKFDTQGSIEISGEIADEPGTYCHHFLAMVGIALNRGSTVTRE